MILRASKLPIFLFLAFLSIFIPSASAQSVPPEVEGVRFADATTLQWNVAPEALGHHVYRGTVSGLSSGQYGDCDEGSIPGSSAIVPEVPTSGTAYTFLVAGFNENGTGPLGSASNGSPRTSGQECATARRLFRPVRNGAAADGVEDGVIPAQNASSLPITTRREATEVVLSTGEFVVRDVDLALRGRFADDGWKMSRIYRSQVSYDGAMGKGWIFADGTFLFSRDGSQQEMTIVDMRAPGGAVFTRTPTGYRSPAGRFDVLSKKQEADGTSTFALRSPDGSVVRYFDLDGSNVAGAIKSREDRFGSKTTYHYDNNGLLTRVVDTFGREISYEYTFVQGDLAASGRLRRVTDFEGREVQYTHDAEGNLITVRSPVVLATPNGDTFPSGKTTRYSYTSGFSDQRLNGNLLSITDPLGQTWLTNTYGTAPDALPSDLTFDRVVRQDVGGTNASGIPAGGSYLYAYSALNAGADPGLPDLPRRHVVVTGLDGYVRESTHNDSGQELTHVVQTAGLRADDPASFVTENRYDADGLKLQTDLPSGDSTLWTYDAGHPDRYAQGNLLEVRATASVRGDGHGGAPSDVVTTFTYDPLYQQILTKVSPRGNDPSYVPQNGGKQSAARYTTRWYFDYQEGDPATNGVEAYALEWGLSLGSTEVNLGDLNGDGRLDLIDGRVVRREDPTVNLDPASNQAADEGDAQQEIVTTWSYNDFGQQISTTDPVGLVSRLSYFPENDPDGDGVPTPPPFDGRILDSADGGWLRSSSLSGRVRDRHEYDPRGNLTSHVDARGVRTVRLYNEIDQEVEVRNAAATMDRSGPDGDPATGVGESGLSAPSYKVRTTYDANDNRVSRSVEDRGGTRGAGDFLTAEWVYDMLDRPVEVSRPVSAGTSLSTLYRYDPAGRRTRVVLPEGNETVFSYDERGLLFQSTVGATGPKGGAPAVTTYSYDANGNLRRSEDPAGRLTEYEYDGFDRRVRTIDPVGGLMEIFYDPDSNVVQQTMRGTPNGASPSDRSGSRNVLLSDLRVLYDEMSRVVRKDELLFVPSGVVASRPADLVEGDLVAGDGASNTIFEYDASGRETYLLRDTGREHKRVKTYSPQDGRLESVATGDGSRTEFTYDDAGLLVETVETLIESLTGTETQYVTTFFYDALGRRTMRVDNTGRAVRSEYDSLDAVTLVSDALGPAGGTITRRSASQAGVTIPINDHGNITTYDYDAGGRQIRTTRILTADGRGDGTTAPAADGSNPYNPSGTIVREYEYDGNGNRVLIRDARGNETSYAYDNLDRLLSETFANAGSLTYSYDAASNPLTTTDPNGAVATHTYDALDRIVSTAYSGIPAPEGTSLQTYEYDGLGRLTRAVDDNSPEDVDDDAIVEFSYDSLGRLFEERQRLSGELADEVVSYGLRAEDLQSALIYPSGRRLDYSYDGFGRLTEVLDSTVSGGSVRFTNYAGMHLVMQREAGTDLTTTYTYDGNARVVRVDHSAAGLGMVAGFEYSYDENDAVLGERRLHDGSGDLRSGDLSNYDSARRATRDRRANLLPDFSPSGVPRDEHIFSLDAAGNIAEVDRDGTSYRSTPNNLNLYDEEQCCGKSSDDRVADDYLDRVSTVAPDGRNFSHDVFGNQTSTGDLRIVYDALNRAIRVARVADGAEVARYRYDPLDRLVRHEVRNSGLLDHSTRLFYAAGRVIESVPDGGALERQEARTPGGQPLWQLRDFAQGASAEHILLDGYGSAAALVMPDGSVLERVVYTSRGTPLFQSGGNVTKTDAAGDFLAESDYSLRDLFATARYLPELGKRASTIDADWGGGYLSGGTLYGTNVGRALAARSVDRSSHDARSASIRNTKRVTPPTSDELRAQAVEALPSRLLPSTDFGLGDGGEPRPMTKAELVDAMAKETGEASGAFDISKSSAMKRGSRAALAGVVATEIWTRSARVGRNPQTGKEIQIKAKNSRLSEPSGAQGGDEDGDRAAEDNVCVPDPCPEGSKCVTRDGKTYFCFRRLKPNIPELAPTCGPGTVASAGLCGPSDAPGLRRSAEGGTGGLRFSQNDPCDPNPCDGVCIPDPSGVGHTCEAERFTTGRGKKVKFKAGADLSKKVN